MTSSKGTYAGAAVLTGLYAILILICGLAELIDRGSRIGMGIGIFSCVVLSFISAIFTQKAVDKQ